MSQRRLTGATDGWTSGITTITEPILLNNMGTGDNILSNFAGYTSVSNNSTYYNAAALK